jgi:hypothetical protein
MCYFLDFLLAYPAVFKSINNLALKGEVVVLVRYSSQGTIKYWLIFLIFSIRFLPVAHNKKQIRNLRPIFSTLPKILVIEIVEGSKPQFMLPSRAGGNKK